MIPPPNSLKVPKMIPPQSVFLFSLGVTPLSPDQGCLCPNPNWHDPLHWVRTKWMKTFGSTWNQCEMCRCVNMIEYQCYIVLVMYIIFKHYIYSVHIYIYIITIYLAIHLWYTCGSDHPRNMYPHSSILCFYNMRQGLNSHYFHIIGDGHQPKSVGVQIPIIRIPTKGGMTIPNIATFDHGTHGFPNRVSKKWRSKDLGFQCAFARHQREG